MRRDEQNDGRFVIACYLAYRTGTCSRTPDEVGHFCSKQYGLTIKRASPGNAVMHEAALRHPIK